MPRGRARSPNAPKGPQCERLDEDGRLGEASLPRTSLPRASLPPSTKNHTFFSSISSDARRIEQALANINVGMGKIKTKRLEFGSYLHTVIQ
jgi:hypothetical protein